jgi:DNA mismatch repair protein MutL
MAFSRLQHSEIKLLPAQLANQIAAGEVVERPASVVKELIENSIDADADSIHIEIDQGGHKRILVRDTGSGIAKEQLELALSRHATSKICDIDDLECITSMGFRGEALASISAVSRLSLTSRPLNQDQAWQAQTQGMEMAVKVSPAAHPQGTSIEVLDLFFNTPARRKFLRAQKTEFQHIDNIVRRIALAHPNVAFSLKHNGKLMFKWAASDLTTRLGAVCGQAFLQQTTPISYQHEQIALRGWCSKIGEAWQTSDQQYIFVNHRMIKDKLVLHAVRQAYEGMLVDNCHPGYVLFLSLPAQDMDVNVHPAKHEVRFHQARQVHDLIFQAISQALVSAQTLVEQTDDAPTHDYIRPLQSHAALVPDARSLAHAQSDARQSSTSSRPIARGTNAPFVSKHLNVAEAGKHYQELMSTKQDHALPAFVRLAEFILFEHADGLLSVTLADIFGLSFEQSLIQGNTSQPLLMPISVVRSTAQNNPGIAALLKLACVIDSSPHKHILKQVPSALRALPWAHIFSRLLERNKMPDATSQCLRVIAQLYLEVSEISAASLRTALLSIPSDDLAKLLHSHGKPITAAALLKATGG